MPVSGGEKPCELAPTNPVREDGGARSQGGPPVTGSACSAAASFPRQRSREHNARIVIEIDSAISNDRDSAWTSANSSARTIPTPAVPLIAISNDRDDPRGHRRIQVHERFRRRQCR